MEDNRLITEFMGLPTKKREVKFTGGFKEVDINFKYHSSWDRLMSVVEKIEKLGYAITICQSNVSINEHDSLNNLQTLIEFESDKKLTSTYLSIVKFIKWYNENK